MRQRADTPRYKSQRDNVWEQQIKSEQLYNALRKGSQASQTNHDEHSAATMSECGDQYFGSMMQQSHNQDIPMQDIHSQGPQVQRQKTQNQDQNSTKATMNSQIGCGPQYQEVLMQYQYPETISISSASSLEDPYMKAESQMDEALQNYKNRTAQLEKHGGKYGQRQSRRKMQEEINNLRLELMAAQEKLDIANKRQQQLEVMVATQSMNSNQSTPQMSQSGGKIPKQRHMKLNSLNLEEAKVNIEYIETDGNSSKDTSFKKKDFEEMVKDQNDEFEAQTQQQKQVVEKKDLIDETKIIIKNDYQMMGSSLELKHNQSISTDHANEDCQN